MTRIVLGKITGVHGIRGEIKVMPYTDTPEAIAQYKPWTLEQPRGSHQAVTASQIRRQGEGLIVKLEGYDDRDESKTLVGSFITIDRQQLPVLTAGYYWVDLIGLQVFTVDGMDLGKIDYLFETGSNDVMVVLGDRERLIPYRPGDVVIEVDLEGGRMIVDWDHAF